MRAQEQDPHPGILLVCLVFHPDASASGQLFTDLLKRAARDGQEAIAVTAFPAKTGDGTSLPRRESYAGVEIYRRGLRIDAKSNLVTRALSYLAFYLHAGLLLWRIAPGRTVLVGSDPPGLPIVVWLLARLRGFSYQCLMLDIYPEGLLALGTLRRRSPIVRLWQWLNRRSYASARALIVLGRDMAPLLRREYGPEPVITYVPHWAPEEIEIAQTRGRDDALRRYGLAHKFVVQYSGNMGLWHDLDTIVRAAELLGDDENIHFLMIGEGRRRPAAERLATELGVTNMTWKPFVLRQQLPQSLAACDAAIVSLRQGLEGIAVPSKLYGILASGRAVVAQVPAGSEVALVVEEERCGLVVAPGSAPDLARTIAALAAQPGETEAMGERARQAYEAKYTIDHALGALRELERDR